MPNIGLPEIIVILVIALIVVGPGRLPDVGAALGKSIREFRKASSDISEGTRLDASPVPPAAATPAPQPNVLAPTPTTPQPNVLAPTPATPPAPIAAPPDPADDEPTNLPA